MTNKQLAEEKVRYYVNMANKLYGANLSVPTIKWTLRGHTAGTANSILNEINLHIGFLEEHPDEYLSRTVPHEVAHIVVGKIWKHDKIGDRRNPHGYHWKMVMRQFGAEGSRCHNYQSSNTFGLPRVFQYKCNCRVHDLTQIRHRRLQSGKKYFCTSCKSELKWVSLANS